MNDAIDLYKFPDEKLISSLEKESPVVLLMIGTFSPITNMHLRALEMARDAIHSQLPTKRVVAGYISPVSDFYQKDGLIDAVHRIKMCKLATQSSTWIMVDDWECRQKGWSKTVDLLHHLNEEIENAHNSSDFKIAIVMGSDLFISFENQSVWTAEELQVITGQFIVVVIERDTDSFSKSKEMIFANDLLYKNRTNIILVNQFVPFTVSSTKIRMLIRRGHSVKYLIDDKVAEYIESNSLYKDDLKIDS